MLIPIILLIAAIVSGVVIWFVYKRIKRGFSGTIQKGVDVVNDQQQKWTEKGQRKKLPSMLQKGFDDYDQMKSLVVDLPDIWKQPLQPLVKPTKEILDEVAFEYISDDSNKPNKPSQDKKLNSIRPFFHHSLDALLQLVEKLSSDHAKMNEGEIQKARDNITILKADLQSHQETLHKVRRFDFDVVMDVIKARLKK